MVEVMTQFLALWSAPRSRSTAFARMMIERGDFTVVHEPFSHVVDFGTAEVGDAVAHTETEVMAALTALAGRGPLFFKDTTDFHYPGLLADTAFLRGPTHTFLIRHPVEAIASHAALSPDVGRDEIGFAWLAEIFDAVAAATGRPPVVVDSDDLVDRPQETVAAYCATVGIPYRPEAMSWDSGMQRSWQQTGRWHESTSRTRGFERVPAGGRPVEEVRRDPVLAGYLDHHLPHYERLRAAALRP